MRLTARRIDSSKPAKKPYSIWCDDMPGFGVRINPGGSKQFVVRYRNRGRQTKTYTIGRTDRLTVEIARDEARKVFALVAQGKDPASERSEYAESETWDDMCREWRERHAKTELKPYSASRYEIVWRLHILPQWGKKKVRDTDEDMIRRIYEKNLAVYPGRARMIIALISKCMSLAEVWGWRTLGSNPCRLIDKSKSKSREIGDPLTIEQLQRLGAEMAKSDDQIGYRAIRLLLLTGCRRNEIMGLRWEWVDFDRRMIKFPDTKTGAGEVDLVDAAIDELRYLESRRLPFNPHVFWSPKYPGQHRVFPYTVWRNLLKRAGLKRIRPHDMRHTFGTLADELGHTQAQIAAGLRHKMIATTARYTHARERMRRQTVESTAGAIAAAIARK